MNAANAGKVIGGLVLAMVIVGGFFWLREAQKMRIRDYANLMTETHTRAIKLYDDAEALQQRLMAERREPTAEELASVKDAFLAVAEKTRQEKEAFARVMPPPDASALQGDALAFLDIRAQRAESFAHYYELLERQQRGQAVTRAELSQAMQQAQHDQNEVMRLAKALRNKKDELTVR